VAESAQLENLKDLFYRSQFTKLLGVLDALDSKDSIVASSPEFALLKANAYCELQQQDKAVDTLKDLVKNSADALEGSYLYALARLSYMDNDLQNAYEIFCDLLESTDDERLQFKSLLGMANVLYTNGNTKELDPVLFDLKRFEPLHADDEKISLLLFFGNYHCHFSGNFEESQKFFRQALEISARRGWNYFICRSIYGQAVACERAGKTAEMNWTLNTLRAFVNDSESIFFSTLVNKRFKSHDFALKVPMEFDCGNRRIMIEDRWVAFHDKPLIYRFLEVLHGSESFIPKDAIARQLWPEEDYKARLHDPRLFDIAKRVRDIVEKYQKQPVVLLSGRLGYKLACV
jgi:hypothetical protein